MLKKNNKKRVKKGLIVMCYFLISMVGITSFAASQNTSIIHFK